MSYVYRLLEWLGLAAERNTKPQTKPSRFRAELEAMVDERIKHYMESQCK